MPQYEKSHWSGHYIPGHSHFPNPTFSLTQVALLTLSYSLFTSAYDIDKLS